MKRLIALLFACSLMMAACGDGSVPYIEEPAPEADLDETPEINLSPAAIEFMRNYRSPAEQMRDILDKCPTVISCAPNVATENLRVLSPSVIDLSRAETIRDLAPQAPGNNSAALSGGSITANSLLLYPLPEKEE